MVGERIKVIPSNIKATVNELKQMKIKNAVVNTGRRFMAENKSSYYRTKGLVQRGYGKAKGAVRRVIKR